MKITLEFPVCSVCRSPIPGAPHTCDLCIAKVHDGCMGPDREDWYGDLYRHCLNCERGWGFCD